MLNDRILSKYEKPPYVSMNPEQIAFFKLIDRVQILEDFTVKEITTILKMLDLLKENMILLQKERLEVKP